MEEQSELVALKNLLLQETRRSWEPETGIIGAVPKGWRVTMILLMVQKSQGQPPGMYKTLSTMGYLPYQLVSRISSIISIAILRVLFRHVNHCDFPAGSAQVMPCHDFDTYTVTGTSRAGNCQFQGPTVWKQISGLTLWFWHVAPVIQCDLQIPMTGSDVTKQHQQPGGGLGGGFALKKSSSIVWEDVRLLKNQHIPFKNAHLSGWYVCLFPEG